MLNQFSSRFQQAGCISSDSDFESIVRWVRAGNWSANFNKQAPSNLKTFTGDAYSLQKSPEERVRDLCNVKYIGMNTATALLAFWQPNKFSVMTKPSLETLVDYGLWSHSTKPAAANYQRYLHTVRGLAHCHGMKVRDVDRALVAMGSSKF